MRLHSAFADIFAERWRQMTDEGYTPEYDQQHATGELLRAGCLYYMSAKNGAAAIPLRKDGHPFGWPWAAPPYSGWKPKDARADLIRAGALMLAERDLRLARGMHYMANIWHKLGLVCETLAALDR